MTAPFSCRSALVDVEAGRQTKRLAVDLELEGANTRLLWIAADVAAGGRIPGAAAWGPARWYREAGFYPRYMLPRLEKAGLVRREGDDLVVLEYVAAHENRLRYLRFVQVPAMMEARGFDPTRYGGAARPAAPPAGRLAAPPSMRVNCAKRRTSPPTEQLNCAVEQPSRLNPDPETRAASSSPSDPAPPRRRPPDHPDPDRSDHPTEGPPSSDHPTETGPEGFERWWSAMPVPKQRQPRDPRVWRVWRERALEHWVRHDLEGEADQVLAELERRKRSDAWTKTPWYIPSGINFLRAASWRARRPRPAKLRAPEVYVPAPTWRPPASQDGELEALVRRLAEGLS